MNPLSALIVRLTALFRRKRLECQLDEELRAHLEMLTEENVRRGLPPEEARYLALRSFGGVEQVKEEYREQRGLPMIETLMQDVRYGLRQLRRSPGFTAVAVLTLALGIGANTAIFSVVEGVLLAPLPYLQPDRLVVIWESNPRFPHTSIDYPNFQDWQREARSFERMTAFGWKTFDLTGPGPSEHVEGKEIAAGFFAILGVKLALGRDFSTEEDQQGGAPVVIVSDRLWKNRLAGSSAALGKIVTLDGVDYTVVGVAPPQFEFEGRADIYTPLAQGDRTLLNPRGSHNGLLGVARLRSGVNIAQAQAEMNSIQARLDQLYPADQGLGVDLVRLKRQIVGDVGGILLLLFGAVGIVLLIACANVANLLLARSAGRTREFAVRLALGASRARMVKQLLTENVLLSIASGALSLILAAWGVHPLLTILPESVPRSENIRLNAPVLLFTLGIALAVGLLFGLAPALKTSKVDLEASLKQGSRGSTGSHHRLQSGLVIAQMASTLVLLVGAGLLFQTIRHLWESDPGFDTQHVIAFKVELAPSVSKSGSAMRVAYQQLLERLRIIPGVQAADFTLLLPLSGIDNDCPFWIGPRVPAVRQAAPRMLVFNTGPDYLRTMGIPLLRGRFFTSQDTIGSPCVAAIDAVFACTYFPGQDPLGQTLTFGWTPSLGPCRIVGVVGHVKHWGLGEEKLTQAQSYYPLYQIPDEWLPIGRSWTSIIVRTQLDPAAALPAIKRAVYGPAGDQPVYDVQTMQDVAAQSMASQRFPMLLLDLFAGLALLLAAVGIYGMFSYSVTQRVHEIGIRMALGAHRGDVFRLVLGQGLRLVLAGLAIGAAAALILTRLLPSFSHLLYGVKASDPMTFGIVSVLLTGVAILACYIPAHRAAKVDPMVALRHE